MSRYSVGNCFLALHFLELFCWPPLSALVYVDMSKSLCTCINELSTNGLIQRLQTETHHPALFIVGTRLVSSDSF